MKTASVAGIALLLLGIVSLAYQGITYNTHKKIVDMGPIQATETEKHTVPLPPVLGGLAILGGIALLVAGTRS